MELPILYMSILNRSDSVKNSVLLSVATYRNLAKFLQCLLEFHLKAF